MADKSEADDGIKIYPPDRSLHAKIGNVSLEKILSPQTMQSAQMAIKEASGQFLTETLGHMAEVGRSYESLVKKPDDAGKFLPVMAEKAFSAKVSAGLGGYDLVSSLAKSLSKQCESFQGGKPNERGIGILKWHIDTIQKLLDGRVTGSGGAVGTSLLAELERLNK